MTKIAQSVQVPVKIVGGNNFGRYKKISAEKTYNMFISDEWLVNYAGYKAVLKLLSSGEGRGLFNSVRNNFMLAVINATVFKIDSSFIFSTVGTLSTSTGDVFMDENLSGQICIVDGLNAYIFDNSTSSITTQTLTITPPVGAPYDVVPNYVCYHNTFFLISSAPASPNPSSWYAFQFATNTTISWVSGSQFTLQTKPDIALAVQRLPGRSNNVLVLGNTVAEVWTQVGGVQNYQRVSSFNIDTGVVSVSTIAASEKYLCYLAKNENNAPFIMVTDGGTTNKISNDGIDNILGRLNRPDRSNAFFYRQDGHLFYQISFYDSSDNFSLIYDFNTSMFFYVTDENLNYHPARQIVYFGNKTYFISLRHGSIFEMDTELVTADYQTLPGDYGQEIPRIRITNTIRKEDNSRFRVGYFCLTLEQGMPNNNPSIQPAIDLSFSKDGNQSYSNVVRRDLHPVGKFKNRLNYYRFGSANEFTIQLRFYGFTRFVCRSGIAEIY
jgi:hypothetical protein